MQTSLSLISLADLADAHLIAPVYLSKVARFISPVFLTNTPENAFNSLYTIELFCSKIPCQFA